jgi:ICEA Protein
MPDKKKTKIQLFLELAQPDENGFSRWVLVSEFADEYKDLFFTGNGASWARSDGTLGKTYIIERDDRLTNSNAIDRIRLGGFNPQAKFNRNVRPDIRKYYEQLICVVLGTSTKKAQTDHKNGRLDDPRVGNTKTQTFEDFQPLSQHANTAKRRHCNVCKDTVSRFDARLLGYPVSVVEGKLKYEKPLGCVGCFWYDPLEFRKKLNFTD